MTKSASKNRPKQQPFDKALSGMGMAQRELVQKNPATAFGVGPAAKAAPDMGANSTAPGIVNTQKKSVGYKGRKITAQPDMARVTQGKGQPIIPAMVKPVEKNKNVKRM